MNTDIFRAAEDKRFTDFSNVVKDELKQKLSGREEIKNYVDDYEKIQQMKASFAQINTQFGDKPEEE